MAFGLLFRTMVRHYFSLSVVRERYLKRREELWKPTLGLLGIAVGLAPLLYGYVRLLQFAYRVAAGLQQPGLVVGLGLVTVQVLVLFFGLFYLMSVFYFSTDLEQLVPLPLGPQTILGAKFGVVLITEYVTVLPLVVPPLIIYGIGQGMGLGYWLEALFIVALLPLLPLALSAIVVVVIMKFTGLARHRDMMRVLAGLGVTALVLVAQWNLSKMGTQGVDPTDVLTQLIATPNSLLNIVGKRFPPALWGALALTETGVTALRYLLAYLGSTAASLGLLWILARRFFYQGLLQTATQRHPNRRRTRDLSFSIAARSPLAALVQREWLLVVRHPIFAMTLAFNLLLPPIVLALPIMGAGEQLISVKAALNHPRFDLWSTLVVAALYATMGPLSLMPSTAISREGRLFWISRTIPVAPAQQLLSKLVFSVAIVAPAALAIVLVAAPFFAVPSGAVAQGTILGLLGLFVSSALCLAIDALWPRLEWDNPQQAMKGNFNGLLALVAVGVVGYGLVRIALWLVALGWPDAAVLFTMALLLLLLAAGSWRGLARMATLTYAPRALPVVKEGRAGRAALPGLLRSKGRGVLYLATVLVLGAFLAREVYTVYTLDYTFEDNAVRFASVELAYTQITEVRYLERIPTLSNRVGTSIGNYKTGTFTVEGIGRGKVFANDVSRPALLLRTSDTFYIITPENAWQRYSELLGKTEQQPTSVGDLPPPDSEEEAFPAL